MKVKRNNDLNQIKCSRPIGRIQNAVKSFQNIITTIKGKERDEMLTIAIQRHIKFVLKIRKYQIRQMVMLEKQKNKTQQHNSSLKLSPKVFSRFYFISQLLYFDTKNQHTVHFLIIVNFVAGFTILVMQMW